MGELIQYTFTIRNDGNAPVAPPYTITDSLLNSSAICPSTPAQLQPTGTVVCTGHHALTAQDINRGSVTNTATASAQYGSQTVTSDPASATVATPQLFLAITANPSSVSRLPATVTYTYTLTNRTTSTMSNITIINGSRAVNGLPSPCVSSLKKNKSASCTATYAVTQTDLDSPTGYFSYTATATTGAIQSNQAGVNVTIAQAPAITLTKSAAPVIISGSYASGQTITYSYEVTNIGNVTLTFTAAAPLKITDDDPRVGGVCTLNSGSLAPNAAGPASKTTCTAALTITDADILAGSVTSTGTATATFSSTALTGTSTYTLITFADPRLALVKTADKLYFTAAERRSPTRMRSRIRAASR